MTGMLEHVNLTVTDPERTAELLCKLFDWRVRWAGPSQMGGRTVHVGAEDNYVAVYTPEPARDADPRARGRVGGLNHLGVVVDDLEEAEARVVKAGLKPFNHMDYEPGRRFYFYDEDGVEYEVVSYA